MRKTNLFWYSLILLLVCVVSTLFLMQKSVIADEPAQNPAECMRQFLDYEIDRPYDFDVDVPHKTQFCDDKEEWQECERILGQYASMFLYKYKIHHQGETIWSYMGYCQGYCVQDGYLEGWYGTIDDRVLDCWGELI